MEFEIKAKDCFAKGQATDSGFVVRAGALVRRDIVASAQHNLPAIRKKLTDTGVIGEVDGQLKFLKDHLFQTPSGAAAAVMGRTANGWIEWKSTSGKSLGQVKRDAEGGPTSLSERKKSEILARYQELLADSKLIPNEQLQTYYSSFQSRFNVEVLQKMDGEQLLSYMHDHKNRDSLVYWLEFKNDEDFQTRNFGSIAGGNALKFGIFRRKETGIWQAADETNRPSNISLEQAIATARKHRDQMVQGVRLLNELRENGSDEDYAGLQSQMDELAPDVSGLAWGHKYFSLFFPNKLDDFHSPLWQRFHLIRLLQLPPEGEGRYLCAGRYVAGAHETGLSMNHFTFVLNSFGDRHQYWRIESDGPTSQRWLEMTGASIVGMNWSLPELSWVKANKVSRDEVKKQVTGPGAASQVSEIINFVGKMSPGDVILGVHGDTVHGVGQVTGDYVFDQSSLLPHQKTVKWLGFDEWRLPEDEGVWSGFGEIKKHEENILAIERQRQIHSETPLNPPKPPVLPPGKRKFRLTGIPGRIQASLEKKGQVILFGPPGTGKTYWADLAARQLAASMNLGKSLDQVTDAEASALTSGGNAVVRWCCFHPAYGYEDFIEGYRPTTKNDQMQFSLRDGIFKNMCSDARKSPGQHFFLVIDEINRGDIPRIFGELLMIMEKDKRGKQVALPVSQSHFSVPDNLHIIGTMNTADRSISLLDAALRRRFGFIELMPDGSVLRDVVIKGIPLRGWFEALNQRIRLHVGRDARNLQVGHSYLMTAGKPISTFEEFKRAVRDDIIPLIEEYCYEDFNALQQILGPGMFDATSQQIRQELFEDQDANLVQALLEPCPDISTSSELVDNPDVAEPDDESVDEEEA